MIRRRMSQLRNSARKSPEGHFQLVNSSQHKSEKLDLALFRNNYIDVLYCLDHQIGFGYVDLNGNTALHVAAMRKSICCGTLINYARIDPNVRNNNGETPLHIFASASFADVTAALQSFTISSHMLQQMEGMKFNHDEIQKLRDDFIVISNHQDTNRILKALLQFGSDPNAKASDQSTPLIRAIRFQAPKAWLILLMQYGANPKLADSTGKNALNWAGVLGLNPQLLVLDWILLAIVLQSAKFTCGKKSKLKILPTELLRQLCMALRPRRHNEE
jgi:ankyrin repeat protein